MAKTTRRTLGTPLRNDEVEVRLRGQGRGKIRRRQVSTAAPLPKGMAEKSIAAHTAAGRSPPRHIDGHVGARIRDRRILIGMSQQQVAELIGVTCQQAYKYEKSLNRVPAGRLYEIALALGVQVSHFYHGLLDEGDSALSPNQRMLVELARTFLGIQDHRLQEAVVSFARTLAQSESDK